MLNITQLTILKNAVENIESHLGYAEYSLENFNRHYPVHFATEQDKSDCEYELIQLTNSISELKDIKIQLEMQIIQIKQQTN